jgi:hypothetical protein
MIGEPFESVTPETLSRCRFWATTALPTQDATQLHQALLILLASGS